MEIEGSNFDEEINALKSEAAELDKLYNDSVTVLENVKNSRTRGSLAFTHLQTGNLIAIKNAKISAIKGIMTLKEKKFKQEIQQKLMDDAANSGGFAVGELIDILTQNNVSYKPKNFSEAVVVEDEEEDFEKQVREQLAKSKEVAKASEAQNDSPDFVPDEYVPPEPEKDPDSIAVEDLVEIPVKTDEYEIVAESKTGKIHVIDNAASHDDTIVEMDKELLGINEDEVAEMDFSGVIPKAKFRGKDIEVVEIES